MNGNPCVGEVFSQTVETRVVAETDVLVCGGGTAGCLAAVAAARQGARTMLIERRHYLGGMLTGGNAGLTMYTGHAKDQAEYRELIAELRQNPKAVQIVGGITMEMTQRLIDEGIGLGTAGTAGSYVFNDQARFKSFMLDWMREEGVEFLFHAPTSDVLMDGEALRGVVIETKTGREAILGGMVIDATGDGDVAARAGVPFQLGVTTEDECVKEGAKVGTLHPMGFMFRAGGIDMHACFEWLAENPKYFLPQPFARMTLDDARRAFDSGEMFTINITNIGHRFQIYNTPQEGVFIFCCPSWEGNGLDPRDLTTGEVEIDRDVRKRMCDMRENVPGFENAWLVDCPEVWTRESRHFQGEYTLDIRDVMETREFPDTIGRGGHPIDTHPRPAWVKDYPIKKGWYFNIPYRCLVPVGVENLLLAGRHVSATHEASGCVRPTAQCMITGEAAGVAAALCLARKEIPRTLDPAALREALEANGSLL